MKVYSFPRGGITFEDSTVPSMDKSVTGWLPGISIIPLNENSCGRAYPIVSIGDIVREGMLIGRSQGAGTANIHATVPGRVIKMVSWKMANGQQNDAFVIRMEGNFEKLGKHEEAYPWEGMHPYDLQRLITDYGVLEMDEGRPVSELIASLRNAAEPVTMVVRCVFDDPWLAADYVLCRERTRAVVEGSRIIARVIRATRIIFAVSHREKELGEMLRKEAGNWDPPSSLVFTGSRYPQRNRRELEYTLKTWCRKEDMELGSCMILGPSTLAAIHDAVRFRKPVLDRYIAVGGSAVKKPQIMKIRIGTRISEIFAQCGGFTGHPGRISFGSPLCGRTAANLDEPVIKTSYALFALLEGSQYDLENQGSCISCGECRSVCPVSLDPEELYKRTLIKMKPASARGDAAEYSYNRDTAVRESSDRENSRSQECHGCGCCEIVCPSRLPLSAAIVASGVESGAFDAASIRSSAGIPSQREY